MTACLPTFGSFVLPRRPSPRSRTRRLSDRLGLNRPPGYRNVSASNRVKAKLVLKVFLGLGRAGEDHQAARFTIQAVDGTNAPDPALVAAFAIGDQPRQEFIERRLNLAFSGRQLALVGMAGRRDSGRLLNHHDVLVEIADADIFFAGSGRDGMRKDFDDITQSQAISGVFT